MSPDKEFELVRRVSALEKVVAKMANLLMDETQISQVFNDEIIVCILENGGKIKKKTDTAT